MTGPEHEPQRKITAVCDAERGYLERLALLRLLIAARNANVNVTAVCTLDGLRSIDVRAGHSTVRLSFPIWFVPDNTAASWQVDILNTPDSADSDAGPGSITVMSGLGLDADQTSLTNLLRTVTDPHVLNISLSLVALGEEPHLVFAAPFI